MIFWAVMFLLWSSFLYFGGVFNKTIIPLALVGYEMIIANSLSIISYPTRAHGIIVKYPSKMHTASQFCDVQCYLFLFRQSSTVKPV